MKQGRDERAEKIIDTLLTQVEWEGEIAYLGQTLIASHKTFREYERLQLYVYYIMLTAVSSKSTTHCIPRK